MKKISNFGVCKSCEQYRGTLAPLKLVLNGKVLHSDEDVVMMCKSCREDVELSIMEFVGETIYEY